MILHEVYPLGIVKKHRMLYMVGQTRVHIDEVEGLGHYLELEVYSIYISSDLYVWSGLVNFTDCLEMNTFVVSLSHCPFEDLFF